MKRITASKAQLLVDCPVAHVLPWADDTSQYQDARDFGTRAHKWYEHAVDDFGEFAHITRPTCPEGGQAWHEICFWWDTVDDRFGWVKMEKERDYDAHFPAHYIVGTADWVSVTPRMDDDPLLTVCDLKTSKRAIKAMGNAQLELLAYMAAKSLGHEHSDIELVIHNAPREKTTGKSGRGKLEDWDIHELRCYTEDLNEIADKFRGSYNKMLLANALQNDEKEFYRLAKVGPSCYYCPARPNCKAYAEHKSGKTRED